MFKHKTHRSEKYLEFIRSHPCVITGSSHEVVAHHVRMFGGGGTGLKPPDYLCIPIMQIEHNLLHSIGERSYFAERKTGIQEYIFEMQCEYLEKIASKEKLIFHIGELIAFFEKEKDDGK